MRHSLVILFTALALSACTIPGPTPDAYGRSQSARAYGVKYGEVAMVRSVPLPGRSTAVGRTGGTIVGAVVGSTVGDGVGQIIASSAGAVVGAVAGEHVEEAVTRKDGLEITVRMDDGAVVTVVQEATVEFVAGERVRILMRANDQPSILKDGSPVPQP